MAASRTKKRLTVGVATACILAAGSAAGAIAAAGPSAAATASPATPVHQHLAHHQLARGIQGLLARTDHATIEVKQHKSWVTLTVDRGSVTAVSASSITLLRPDGQSVTATLGATTHYRGAATSPATVTTGGLALVISEGGTARTVVEPKAHPARHKAAKARPAQPTTPKATAPAA